MEMSDTNHQPPARKIPINMSYKNTFYFFKYTLLFFLGGNSF